MRISLNILVKLTYYYDLLKSVSFFLANILLDYSEGSQEEELLETTPNKQASNIEDLVEVVDADLEMVESNESV